MKDLIESNKTAGDIISSLTEQKDVRQWGKELQKHLEQKVIADRKLGGNFSYKDGTSKMTLKNETLNFTKKFFGISGNEIEVEDQMKKMLKDAGVTKHGAFSMLMDLTRMDADSAFVKWLYNNF